MGGNGDTVKVAMDESGANKTAVDDINADCADHITVQQVKCLNNIVEQEPCAINRVTRPMLGSKSFRYAAQVIAGVELMHMIRRGQFAIDSTFVTFVHRSYALAGRVSPA